MEREETFHVDSIVRVLDGVEGATTALLLGERCHMELETISKGDWLRTGVDGGGIDTEEGGLGETVASFELDGSAWAFWGSGSPLDCW